MHGKRMKRTSHFSTVLLRLAAVLLLALALVPSALGTFGDAQSPSKPSPTPTISGVISQSTCQPGASGQPALLITQPGLPALIRPEQPPAAVENQPVKMPEEPVEDSPEEPASLAIPVEDSYFSDAVFLGDSRTEGFHLYSGLKEGTYFYAVGATVDSVFTKATEKTASGKIPILDAMKDVPCSKVYIMLGVNELGWVNADVFAQQYGKVVDRVREDHPDAKIVLQSLPPVSRKQEAKKTYVNNGRIVVYNDLIRQLAEEKNCTYLDVAGAVQDAEGFLPSENSTDGVHLNTKGCKLWLEYLKNNPV